MGLFLTHVHPMRVRPVSDQRRYPPLGLSQGISFTHPRLPLGLSPWASLSPTPTSSPPGPLPHPRTPNATGPAQALQSDAKHGRTGALLQVSSPWPLPQPHTQPSPWASPSLVPSPGISSPLTHASRSPGLEAPSPCISSPPNHTSHPYLSAFVPTQSLLKFMSMSEALYSA